MVIEADLYYHTEQGIPGQQGAARYGYRRVGRQGNAHFPEIVEEILPTIENIFNWYVQGDSAGRHL